MRIIPPLLQGFLVAPHSALVVEDTRRIDADVGHPLERETYRGAVLVYQTGFLEGVAYDGDPRRPDTLLLLL